MPAVYSFLVYHEIINTVILLLFIFLLSLRKLIVNRKSFVEQIKMEDISFWQFLEHIKGESYLLDLCDAEISVGETVHPGDNGFKMFIVIIFFLYRNIIRK